MTNSCVLPAAWILVCTERFQANYFIEWLRWVARKEIYDVVPHASPVWMLAARNHLQPSLVQWKCGGRPEQKASKWSQLCDFGGRPNVGHPRRGLLYRSTGSRVE